MYLYVRIDARGVLTKKRKKHPSPGDEASTAKTTPGRVGRDEQREARRANTTPNGGPHLELGLRRDDTHLGPAHARNYRGCTRRQIETVHMCDTVLPRGTTSKINRF